MFFRIVICAACLFFSSIIFAETQNYKIGFVGSLTGFASEYGGAVLDGVQLAKKEIERKLANNNIKISLIVEDDLSQAKNAVSAYTKLAKADKVDILISGTWWANSFVKLAEKDKIVVLSCETLFDRDTVKSPYYYILPGYLKDWINVYEPIIKRKSWKKAAILRFSSGFGGTLEDALRERFSANQRSFIGSAEYSEIEMKEAASILLKIVKLNPDVLYIDAQPAGIANFLKRYAEQKSVEKNTAKKISIITNNIAEVALDSKLAPVSSFENIYFTRNAAFDSAFENSFKEEYKRAPKLRADIGMLAFNFAFKILREFDSRYKEDPKRYLLNKELDIFGKKLKFDQNNVNIYAAKQEIFQIRNGEKFKVN